MRILKDDALLVVVDVQEKLFPHMTNNQALSDKLVQLIKGIYLLEIPVLVTEQYVKGLGPTIPALLEVLGDTQRLEKLSFSCHDDPAFKQAVKDSGKKVILVCGIESHVCIQQTLLDLQEDGYIPVLIVDAVTSRKPSDMKISLKRIQQEGIRMASVESILFELTRYAGTDTFRSLSKLVK